MNDRTCIVTRQAGDPDRMIRFVAGPDMTVVPDLRRNLPGRGCWVTATRSAVDQAVRKKLFRRALKAEVDASPELGALVDSLLVRAALGSLGLARKAGQVATGAAKTEASVRTGKALAVLHALEAQPDGERKIAQARRAVEYAGGPFIRAWKLFPEAELGLALGGTNVIHAAVLGGDAGKAAVRRLIALNDFREMPGENAAVAAEDME